MIIRLDVCWEHDYLCKGAVGVVKAVKGAPGAVAQTIHDTILSTWGQGVLDGLDRSMLTLGTFWVKVPTPDLGSDTSAAAWAEAETRWVQLALVIGSLVFAGGRLIWTRRGEDLRKVVEGLARVVVMSVVGWTMLSMLLSLTDITSTAILGDAIGDANGNFATKLLTASALQTMPQTSAIVLILVGLIGIVANLVQLALMVVRSAMLVLFYAVLPMAVAAAITDWGAAWVKKMIGWIISFAMMKPAAALIYAVAIKLVEGETWDISQGDEVMTLILGVTLMVLAALALPALVGFIVPVAASISSGGAGAGASAAGIVATGAMVVQRSSGKGGGAPPSGSSSKASKDASKGAPAGAKQSVSQGATKAGASGASSAAAAGAGAATGGVATAAMVAAKAAKGATSAAQGAAQEASGAKGASR